MAVLWKRCLADLARNEIRVDEAWDHFVVDLVVVVLDERAVEEERDGEEAEETNARVLEEEWERTGQYPLEPRRGFHAGQSVL